MKIQLFVIVNETNKDEWTSIINHIEDFSGFDSVHLLYFGSQSDMLNRFSRLINKGNFYLNVCWASPEYQINYLVRKDCDFYLIVSEPDYNCLRQWPEKIRTKQVVLVHPDTEGIYNNMLVSIPLHNYLCGFGMQTINEKIDIHCKNHDKQNLVFPNKEEFFCDESKSTTT